MCNCRQCQAALRINELYHKARTTGLEPWEEKEMHFLAYLLTGGHA